MTMPTTGLGRRVIRGARLLVLPLLGFAAPHANAQTQAVISACVHNNTAQMRLVGAAEACRPGEQRIQWTSQGAAGPQGPAGPVGPQGQAGPAGQAGQAGTPGPKGSLGEAGAAGPQGQAGEAGTVGLAGPQGTQGLAGAAGPKGAPGDQGTPGIAGGTGPAGPAGLTGATGDAGAQGPQGPEGSQGASVQGEVGPQGPEGPAGPDGSAGPTGSIVGTVECSGVAAPAGTLVYVPGRAFTAYTGATGAFTFHHVPAGTYSVVVERVNSPVVTVANVAVAAAPVSVGTVTACETVTPPPLPCGVVCSGTRPICNTVTKRCVECLTNANCSNPLKPICTSFICGTGGVL